MSVRKSRLVTINLVVLLAIMVFMPIITQAATDTTQEWRRSSLPMPENAKPCANLSNGLEIMVGEPGGTYLYNLLKNSKTRISPVRVETCSSTTGYGYKATFVAGEPLPQAYSFTLAQPEGTPIAHLPRHIHNNQPDVYAMEYATNADLNKKTRLWHSSDAGKTWEARGQQFGENLESYAASYTNPKVVYATVSLPVANPATATEHEYLVYSSQDSGKTWTPGATIKAKAGSVGSSTWLSTLEGASSQTVALSVGPLGKLPPPNDYLLSTDGGKTFNKVGLELDYAGFVTKLFATPKGLLIFKRDSDFKCSLAYLKDDGQPGQSLAFPFRCNEGSGPRYGLEVALVQNPNNPAVLMVSELDGNNQNVISWISEDSGTTWRQLSNSVKGSSIAVLTFAGNSPAVAMLQESVKSGDSVTVRFQRSLARLVDTSKTATVPADTKSDSLYFRETGHNLSGAFKSYWEKNGGLAQFGYPKTEVFRELNPADGKTYDVQYFERNRFEYHPEHKGTKYEVLLGLLGNQLTEDRRAEASFKPIDIKVTLLGPDTIFFPETGHTLKAEFRKYWEANGGLAMYGYPISEQFEEVSADDGKTYVVQYFERNRFEYHPENKGTKYEVLFGLLGNTLMIQKAWL